MVWHMFIQAHRPGRSFGLTDGCQLAFTYVHRASQLLLHDQLRNLMIVGWIGGA